MTSKGEFMQQKLKNFIKYIETAIGKDNQVYRDLLNYESNFQEFLRVLLSLQNFAKKKDNKYVFEEETLVKFLESRGIQKNVLNAEVIDKINRYFSMFTTVLCV